MAANKHRDSQPPHSGISTSLETVKNGVITLLILYEGLFMTTSAPWKSGVALGLTMAISYTVCTVLYATWPEAGIDFLNALFHRLDFRQLGAPQPMTITMFVSPLLVLTVWGFTVGTVFSWLLHVLANAQR